MERLNNKTSKKLKEAFLNLLETKDISNIKIEEIVASAGFSRSLFYTYFKDIYDLYEKIELETLENLTILLTHTREFFLHGRMTRMDDESLLEIIYPFYHKIERFLKLFFIGKESERFRYRMSKIIRQHFIEEFEMPKSNHPEILELYIEGLVNSHVATISHSFKTYGYLDLKQYINLIKITYFQDPHTFLQKYKKDK